MTPVPKTAADIEAAALGAADSRGHTGSARYIYAAGWAQGFAEVLSETTTSLEALAAGEYTPEQKARADAIAAASRCFQASLSATEGEDDLLYVTQSVQEIARSFAHYIEHGDPAPATLAEHVETAMDLVGTARTVVADALRTIKDNPDLGDRLDQSDTEPVDWDAERRTYAADMPPHLRYTTTDRGFRYLPPIPGTHGGQPAGSVSVRESSAASGPHLWISARHPSDRNDPTSAPAEGCVHIRTEDAWRFADQIRYLVEHHYQGSAVPELPQT